MQKLVLASGLALAVIARAGLAEAQLVTPGCTSFSCFQLQSNLTNPNTNTTTTTTTTTTTSTLANRINASLQGSVLNTGSLNETTANTWSSAMGGAGSSFNNASVSGNITTQTPTKAAADSAVTMTSAMNGTGILQASQNTGANAVQQNSVALTSTVGGALSTFSPTTAR
jgi:hypothetical protein